MNFPDDMRLDDVHGPEFSARIMSVMNNHGVETIGQLRGKLKELDKWRGLGHRSINEICNFFRAIDNPEPEMFEAPEFKAYIVEDRTSSALALIQDVERTILRAALQGRMSAETKRHNAMKLRDAASQLSQLPEN